MAKNSILSKFPKWLYIVVPTVIVATVITVVVVVNNTNGGASNQVSTQNSQTSNTGTSSSSLILDNQDVLEPVITWSKVFSSNHDWFMAEIKNPNSFAIDFTLDVDYYKGSELISTSEDLYYNCLPAGESAIIYHNWEIPAKTTTSHKIRFTSLGKSVYTPISVETKIIETTNKGITINLKPSVKDRSTVNTMMLLWRDGKIVSQIGHGFYDTEEDTYKYGTIETYDYYTLYINAYK